MIEWKDKSSYSRDSQKRTPSIWNAIIGGLEISVHKYSGCGDAWYLTCREIGLEMQSLDTSDPDAAKGRALTFVHAKLEGKIKKYKEIIDSIRIG